MATRQIPLTIDQIGTGSVRFPSSGPIPNITDQSVDPYFKSRMPKTAQVEALQFFPQVKAKYPGIVVLHEWWGLNVQIKNLANRLACEGFGVILPNLYGRLGGMVTANLEVAQALRARLTEADVLQDINACCEFLNTQDHVKQNVHGVIGFGMGGTFAIQFAWRRKRLRGAVSYYGNIPSPAAQLKDIVCPVLYHRPEDDVWVTPEDVEQLRQSAKEFGKQIDIVSYPGTPHAFANDTRPDQSRPDVAQAAWDRTIEFLKECFKKDMQ
ncbi:MAG: dienelactone hydrolase family protein [Nitrospirae bacterium]|nr:dienelactone hydrolase family protein [Nitrospirota bacterium]